MFDLRAQQRLPSGRHGLPREVVEQSQRERMIVGMAHAAAAKGYRSVTVEDVLHNAGVSRKTFYEFFTDKENCFLVALDTLSSRIEAKVAEQVDADQDWLARVRTLLSATLGIFAQEPDLARMCITETTVVGPEAVRRRDAIFADLLAALEQAREQSDHGDRIPQIAAGTVLLGVLETCSTLAREGRSDELPGLVPDFMYVLVSPFVGPKQAARELDAALAV